MIDIINEAEADIKRISQNQLMSSWDFLFLWGGGGGWESGGRVGFVKDVIAIFLFSLSGFMTSMKLSQV